MSAAGRSEIAKKFGLSFDDYMLLRGNQCPLCQKNYNFANRPAVVDHNHRTGEIRGVCCRQCNEMIGALQERADWMLRVSAWLDGRIVGSTRSILGRRLYVPGSPGAAGKEVTK